jgi:hypothetical protein
VAAQLAQVAKHASAEPQAARHCNGQ